MNKEKILVSACLCGINCKYNGCNNYNEEIFKLVKEGNAIPICPEVLGGLPTPRVPSEIKIINGKKRVINKEGIDVTSNFLKGALEVLVLAKRLNINKCILMSRSPSCGVGKIYDGTFTKKLIDGNGILSGMLIDSNIEVIDVKDYVDKVKVLK